MKINYQLPIKYKKPIRISTWIITAFSIIEAFLSFPPILSGIIAIALTGILYVIERIIFEQTILWVYPFEEKLFDRLGVAWFKEQSKKGQIIVGLATIANSKNDAKKIYQLFRNWCYGKYSGTDENIKIIFVMEGDSKYSMFIYPGERDFKKNKLEKQVKDELNEKNVEYNIGPTLFQYIYNCNEFATRPEIKEAIDIIKATNKVLINACYIKNGKLESHAKRGILINEIEFINRENVTSKRLEYDCKWSDPKEIPEKVLSKLEKIKM